MQPTHGCTPLIEPGPLPFDEGLPQCGEQWVQDSVHQAETAL